MLEALIPTPEQEAIIRQMLASPTSSSINGSLMSAGHMAMVERRGWTVTAAGCWEYDGARFANGYGQVKADGNRVPRLAHRVVFEHHNGPLDPGLVVRHRCDNKPCVNPDHLESGTTLDNKNDSVERGRHAWGEKMWSARLTEDDVRAIRQECDGLGRGVRGKKYRELAERHGVSYSTIERAVRGETWAQLGEEAA